MHVCWKLELLFELFFLIKLHIAGFKEMRLYIDYSLYLIFIDFPFGNPLSSVKFANAQIFRSESNVDIEALLSDASINWILNQVPWEPLGVLKYLST